MKSQYKDKNKIKPNKHIHGACYRCGNVGHYSSECYAKKDVYGNKLIDDKINNDACVIT